MKPARAQLDEGLDEMVRRWARAAAREDHRRLERLKALAEAKDEEEHGDARAESAHHR